MKEIDLISVNRRNPCPICGKYKGCRYNTRLTVCIRTTAGADRIGKGGRGIYYHQPGQKVVIPPPVINESKAPPEKLDYFYRRLIELSPLMEEQRTRHLTIDLRRRGLNECHWPKFGVFPATVLARMRLTDLLIGGCGIPRGVPGFWLDDQGQWRLGTPRDLSLPALIIPVRNPAGLIIGCQLRIWRSENRYLWLSSSKYPHGALSGAPVHYIWPEKRTREWIVLTEGPLKAESFSAFYPGVRVIAIPGTRAGHAEALAASAGLPLAIGFDADWRSNHYVRRDLRLLIAGRRPDDSQLERTRLLVWSGKEKGIDDAARAGRQFELMTVLGELRGTLHS